MAGASFKMDLNPFRTAVGRAVAEIADTQRLAEEIGEALVSGTQDRFEAGESPDGTPWAPTARGGQILVDTGRLRNSVGYEASPAMVAVGTNATYAPTHQFGAEITAKTDKGLRFKVGGRWVRKSSVTVPARPFIGISEADEDEARACVVAHVGRAFGK